MDHQTYPTRNAAKDAINKMSGWDAKLSQLFIPDDANANANGNVFVIEVNGKGDPMYMRSDGYVR
jgi:hypothetical protein